VFLGGAEPCTPTLNAATPPSALLQSTSHRAAFPAFTLAVAVSCHTWPPNNAVALVPYPGNLLDGAKFRPRELHPLVINVDEFSCVAGKQRMHARV